MCGGPWLWERCHGREETKVSVVYFGKTDSKKHCNVMIGMIGAVVNNAVGGFREFLVGRSG